MTNRDGLIRIIQDALWCYLPQFKKENYYTDSRHIAECVLQSLEGEDAIAERANAKEE